MYQSTVMKILMELMQERKRQPLERIVETPIETPVFEPVVEPLFTYEKITQPPQLHDVLKLHEEYGVVGEKENLLRLTFDLITDTSVFLTGKSSAGKSCLMNSALQLVPGELIYRLNDSKKNALFQHGEKYKGKILVIEELQTFFRGSGNEKDALRCIANHEPFHFEDKGYLKTLTARMVMTSGADQNSYKKKYLDGDVELMRRFHEINVELTDEKVKNRINARNEAYKKNFFSATASPLVDASTVKQYFGQCMQSKIGKSCNPFVDFVSEYVMNSIPENEDLTAVQTADAQFKKYMSASLKWHAPERRYNHNGLEGHIASLEDVYIAQKLGGGAGSFDWRACWESGLHSMRESGYPTEILAEYIQRHVINDTIVVKDPVSGESVTLVNYNQPAQTQSTALMPVCTIDGQEHPCEVIRLLPYAPPLLEYNGDAE